MVIEIFICDVFSKSEPGELIQTNKAFSNTLFLFRRFRGGITLMFIYS